VAVERLHPRGAPQNAHEWCLHATEHRTRRLLLLNDRSCLVECPGQEDVIVVLQKEPVALHMLEPVVDL
jgi:hypothetical protein